ncbi:MAG: COX15/CtaA family protein [Acidobacteria bacterium]|nr:COX15/CtaA family protein [Acidobacteriota bacterium]MCA1608627.1 COX15/CtaA family protein [Acidobacteriota bacterium]
MEFSGKVSGFVRYALVVLAWNVIVILWGVFLRASKSGDGCGQYWLTCHGEVIPSAPELKTVIEFSHRVTSGVAFVAVLVLLIWSFRKFPRGSIVRKAALGAFVFIVTEALVGAGLVLTGNTAETLTAARPFWSIGHLINTFILLAFLTLTAWFAASNRSIKWPTEPLPVIFLLMALAGIFFVGISGSIAALSTMIFPSETLSEGFAKDFSAASNLLLRLRISHPIVSILVGIYLIFLSGWLRSRSGNDEAVFRWSNTLSILILLQLVFGAATLLTLAPIVMQVGHLFLADLVWIAFVLLAANYLSTSSNATQPVQSA